MKWDAFLFNALWDAKIELQRVMGADAPDLPLMKELAKTMAEMDNDTCCRNLNEVCATTKYVPEG